jgi:hypothetical protein
MKKLFSVRAAAIIGIALLTMFVIRPRVGRLRGRVCESIAQAVGRQVEISSLHLRFLPRPGFALDNLIVYDDPAFGAEPVLRAPDVTAWLRVGALLRGRIEIASLNISEGSVNLTKNAAGRWNVEDLIERTSKSTLAPTGAGRKGANPYFPYIEATRARINFKVGTEKTHLALTNAEFAFWQESENTWGGRLKAAPIRTDANLTDTGTINVSGVWRRAARAHETPLVISFDWKQAQIGQLSKLVYGADQQWRGGIGFSGTATGTPEKLKVSADASVDDFGRSTVFGGSDVRLSAHCGAEFNIPGHSMSSLDCIAPTGAGLMELKGGASGRAPGIFPFSSYDLRVVATKVPAESVVSIGRQAFSDFDDFSATGNVNGNLEITRAESTFRVQGSGSAQQLKLTSGGAGNAIAIGTVPYTIGMGTSDVKALGKRRVKVNKSVTGVADQIRVEIGPVNLALGRTLPLQAKIIINRHGYEGYAKGDATVKNFLQLARSLRVPAPEINAEGGLSADLDMSQSWLSDDRMNIRGTVQLHSVKAYVNGLNAPMEIANATLAVGENSVRVSNLSAIAAGATWHGTVDIARPCASASTCGFQFNLRTAKLNSAAFNALVNPALARRSWYRIISGSSGQPPFLLQAHAKGRVSVDELAIGAASCSQFSADVALDAGKVAVTDLTAGVLGGHALGAWRADFSKKPPQYSGQGSMEGIDLAQVADLMHDGWIEGTGSTSYDFSAQAGSLEDLLDSAELRAEFSLSQSAFPHIVLTNHSGPLRDADFSGALHLQDGKFSFEDAKLESSAGVYKISGTAALSGSLDLKMSNESAPVFNVTGTLLKTRVTAVPTAEAALKP